MNTKPHILFVCGRNQCRSPAAARLYANDQRIEVRSAGISPVSSHKVTSRDMAWADLVLVMEGNQADRLAAIFWDIRLPPIECLAIPDGEDTLDDDSLSELIRESTESVLAARFGKALDRTTEV
jgi:predicted protein tyrosine phosphatase